MDLPTGNLDVLVALTGFVGVLLAAVITIRLSRGEADPVARWRYRESRHEVATYRTPRRELPLREPGLPAPDALAARRMARLLIGVAILMPILMLAAWVAQPGFMGSYEPPWYELALAGVGGVGYLFGLRWMIRIYRADPEAGARSWRYRR